MPRKRRAAREYAGSGAEPKNRKKAFGWWLSRYRGDIKAGSLPLKVPRGRALPLIAAIEALRLEGAHNAA